MSRRRCCSVKMSWCRTKQLALEVFGMTGKRRSEDRKYIDNHAHQVEIDKQPADKNETRTQSLADAEILIGDKLPQFAIEPPGGKLPCARLARVMPCLPALCLLLLTGVSHPVFAHLDQMFRALEKWSTQRHLGQIGPIGAVEGSVQQ